MSKLLDEILQLAEKQRQRRDEYLTNPSARSAEINKHEAEYISCRRKDLYTCNEARGIAQRIRRQRDVTVHAYRCRYCKFWHVGSPRSKGWGDEVEADKNDLQS
jgi:hypothetical protein